ncbi:uncharacterized protein EV420DRAFT_1561804 [Desarmillaria tabescens]|uniref:Uncharacterized protein n=1 Tax=Armillaria tabescens TaxID=1929756 RepID=A0AA39MXD1_ARMTA|nr:uncharacterized protein EV420DRAFT_1561804 [Desarmillaria tabescens]KAK0450451.1 hypothetical protein EV420DRAFT_1561804 [Desarmillaria tabescens]
MRDMILLRRLYVFWIKSLNIYIILVLDGYSRSLRIHFHIQPIETRSLARTNPYLVAVVAGFIWALSLATHLSVATLIVARILWMSRLTASQNIIPEYHPNTLSFKAAQQQNRGTHTISLYVTLV